MASFKKNALIMVVTVVALMTGSAFQAQAIGGGGGCSIDRVSGLGSTFYVPRGDGPFNILGWGNGTGGTSSTYRGLLEAVAEECILVAAANTSSSGSGADVENAVNEARVRYSNKVGPNPKVCTSGHSQGGGGAFNAANRLDADCVIGLQPDTVYTTRIYSPVASYVDVVCIFSTADTLAPALPFNGPNCRANSTRYSQELTSGSHFTPTYGDGGAPGDEMRSYAREWLVD